SRFLLRCGRGLGFALETDGDVVRDALARGESRQPSGRARVRAAEDVGGVSGFDTEGVVSLPLHLPLEHRGQRAAVEAHLGTQTGIRVDDRDDVLARLVLVDEDLLAEARDGRAEGVKAPRALGRVRVARRRAARVELDARAIAE